MMQREEVSEEKKKKLSKIKGFFGIGLDKLTRGPITCPFCREIFYGMKELGYHIKNVHCH